jgi:hypothetical protein
MSPVAAFNLLALVILILFFIIYPNRFKNNRLKVSKLIALIFLLITILVAAVLNERI